MIALWLGHESPETTRQSIEADLKLKEELLDKAKGLTSEPSRFQPKGKLLDFLDSLSADYYPGKKVGRAFQPDRSGESGWKARPT